MASSEDRTRWLRWSARLVVIPALAWVALRWFERASVFQPASHWVATGAEIASDWQDLTLQTRDGVDLSAWYFPPQPGEFNEVAVVINHGNGGNISHRLGLYRTLRRLGVHLLAYDYRGYGRSAGRPSESGTYLDGEAAIDWLVARGIPESRIVVLGESLGGGIATELGMRRPALRGVILSSTFRSIQDLGAELYPFLPVRTVGAIHYSNHRKLPGLRVPILILHSREDTIIPFPHAEANFAAANSPKWFRIIDGDHNDQPEANPDQYVEAIRDFLGQTRAMTR